MLQVFVLTELYLFISACYLLSDRQGARLLFLINLKNSIDSSRKEKLIMYCTGIALIMGLCFFPMDPGPVIIGDFLPELNILILLFYYLKRFSSAPEEGRMLNKKRDALGYATLSVAVLHFLFPTAVIV